MKNNIRIMIVIAAFGAILSCAGTSFSQTADERLTRVNEAITKKNYDGALTDINEVLRTQPNNARAFYLRGIINYGQKKYDQAIADETKAIELNPNSAEYYYKRGFIYRIKPNHDYKSAIADLNRALEIVPNYLNAYLERGTTNYEMENWSAAESDYTQAIKNGGSAYNDRGEANLKLENYAQAVADFRKAFELYPTSNDVKMNLDLALILQKRYSPQTALADTATSEELGRRASNESDNKEYDSAITDLNEVIRLEPNSSFAYGLRAFCLIMTGEYEKAIADDTKAVALNPNYADGYFNRAIANERLKRYENAIDDFQQSLDLAPSNKVQEALGELLNSLSGEIAESIINPRVHKLTEKKTNFLEKGSAKNSTVREDSGTAAICQYFDGLIPSFNEYRAALHRTSFIKLFSSNSSDNMAEVITSIKRIEILFVDEEKRLNAQRVQYKCVK